ncbi:MAG: hypothetical protein ACRDZ4_04595 [Egibacteraceae bacterium]
MVTLISAPRLVLLALLAALALGAGCAVGEGTNPAGGGPGTTASEQPTGGTGTQTPGTQAPATLYGGQATSSTSGTGGQDGGAAPTGAPHTGAGGTAQGVNLVLLALGGLIAAGGAVTLALRRRCVG